MISINEIRRTGRQLSVPETTVERDYSQNWLLFGIMNSDLEMALKGGTGIRKMYIENYRFSDDLDFTLLEDYSLEELKQNIVKSLDNAKEVSGIGFEDEISTLEVENGYVINTYFKFSGSSNLRLKIKLDLTKKENEKVLLPLSKVEVIHPFSDEFECKVLGYSLMELYSEKIRSLFQRIRPRDLYDIWILSKKNLKVDDIVKEKFESKGVGFNLVYVEGRRNQFLKAWENSLKHQMKEVPKFDAVFDDVLMLLKNIEKSML
jgi:predicted nucleotidyltransferase component of viral defense system